MIADNPAARLLAILKAGKDIPSNENCKKAWKKILDVPRGDDALLMSRLGKVMELPQQIKIISSEKFPNHSDIVTHWSSQVSTGFSKQNFHANWESFYNHIDPHTVNYLQLTAELINEKAETKVLGEEKIAEFRNTLSDILNEVIAADIPVEIKEYVFKSIHKIIISLDEYRITGAFPIFESIEAAFGHAFFDEKYREFLGKNPLGEKIAATLSSVADAMTIVLSLPQLPVQIQLLLQNLS